LASEGSQRIAGVKSATGAVRPDGSVIAPRPRKQKRR